MSLGFRSTFSLLYHMVRIFSYWAHAQCLGTSLQYLNPSGRWMEFKQIGKYAAASCREQADLGFKVQGLGFRSAVDIL